MFCAKDSDARKNIWKLPLSIRVFHPDILISVGVCSSELKMQEPRSKSLLESWDTTFLPYRQPPLIFV